MKFVSGWSIAANRCAAPLPISSAGTANGSLLQVSTSTVSVTVSGAWKKPSGADVHRLGLERSLPRGRR